MVVHENILVMLWTEYNDSTLHVEKLPQTAIIKLFTVLLLQGVHDFLMSRLVLESSCLEIN